MMRAVASVPPPAPQGTISVTGRSGHAAWALPKPTVRRDRDRRQDPSFVEDRAHAHGSS